MRWHPTDVRIGLVDEMTDGSIVTVRIDTPEGRVVVMGEPSFEGRTLFVSGVHMHGVGIGANAFGAAALRALADALLEEMNYDVLVVEGGVRTTGANPGARPRLVRFSRRPRS